MKSSRTQNLLAALKGSTVEKNELKDSGIIAAIEQQQSRDNASSPAIISPCVNTPDKISNSENSTQFLTLLSLIESRKYDQTALELMMILSDNKKILKESLIKHPKISKDFKLKNIEEELGLTLLTAAALFNASYQTISAILENVASEDRDLLNAPIENSDNPYVGWNALALAVITSNREDVALALIRAGAKPIYPSDKQSRETYQSAFVTITNLELMKQLEKFIPVEIETEYKDQDRGVEDDAPEYDAGENASRSSSPIFLNSHADKESAKPEEKKKDKKKEKKRKMTVEKEELETIHEVETEEDTSMTDEVDFSSINTDQVTDSDIYKLINFVLEVKKLISSKSDNKVYTDPVVIAQTSQVGDYDELLQMFWHPKKNKKSKNNMSDIKDDTIYSCRQTRELLTILGYSVAPIQPEEVSFAQGSYITSDQIKTIFSTDLAYNLVGNKAPDVSPSDILASKVDNPEVLKALYIVAVDSQLNQFIKKLVKSMKIESENFTSEPYEDKSENSIPNLIEKKMLFSGISQLIPTPSNVKLMLAEMTEEDKDILTQRLITAYNKIKQMVQKRDKFGPMSDPVRLHNGRVIDRSEARTDPHPLTLPTCQTTKHLLKLFNLPVTQAKDPLLPETLEYNHLVKINVALQYKNMETFFILLSRVLRYAVNNADLQQNPISDKKIIRAVYSLCHAEGLENEFYAICNLSQNIKPEASVKMEDEDKEPAMSDIPSAITPAPIPLVEQSGNLAKKPKLTILSDENNDDLSSAEEFKMSQVTSPGASSSMSLFLASPRNGTFAKKVGEFSSSAEDFQDIYSNIIYANKIINLSKLDLDDMDDDQIRLAMIHAYSTTSRIVKVISAYRDYYNIAHATGINQLKICYDKLNEKITDLAEYITARYLNTKNPDEKQRLKLFYATQLKELNFYGHVLAKISLNVRIGSSFTTQNEFTTAITLVNQFYSQRKDLPSLHSLRPLMENALFDLYSLQDNEFGYMELNKSSVTPTRVLAFDIDNTIIHEVNTKVGRKICFIAPEKLKALEIDDQTLVFFVTGRPKKHLGEVTHPVFNSATAVAREFTRLTKKAVTGIYFTNAKPKPIALNNIFNSYFENGAVYDRKKIAVADDQPAICDHCSNEDFLAFQADFEGNHFNEIQKFLNGRELVVTAQAPSQPAALAITMQSLFANQYKQPESTIQVSNRSFIDLPFSAETIKKILNLFKPDTISNQLTLSEDTLDEIHDDLVNHYKNPNEARAFYSDLLQNLICYIATKNPNHNDMSTAHLEMILTDRYLFSEATADKYSIYASSVDGFNAAFCLAKNGYKEPLETLFQAFAIRTGGKTSAAFQSFLMHRSNNGLTLLHLAAARKDDVIFQSLFTTAKDAFASDSNKLIQFMNITDGSGFGMIHYACNYQNMAVLNATLDSAKKLYQDKAQFEAYLKASTNHGLNILHIACKKGDPALINKMLTTARETFTHKKDLHLFFTWLDNDRYTPFHYACKYGNADAAAVMVAFASKFYDKSELGKVLFNKGLGDGSNPNAITPLLTAAIEYRNTSDTAKKQKFTAIAKVIIQAGADTNHVTPNGETLLQIAPEWASYKLPKPKQQLGVDLFSIGQSNMPRSNAGQGMFNSNFRSLPMQGRIVSPLESPSSVPSPSSSATSEFNSRK